MLGHSVNLTQTVFVYLYVCVFACQTLGNIVLGHIGHGHIENQPIDCSKDMPNSKEIQIAPMRNPIWLFWNKRYSGLWKLVKTVKSECER